MLNSQLEQDLRDGAEYLKTADPILADLIQAVGPIHLPLDTDYFSALIGAIIAQQLSGRASERIRARFMDLFDLNRPFTPANVAALSAEELRGVGLSAQKASYIQDLATRVADESLDLAALASMDDEEVISRLLPVKGIGVWTAQMFLIFSLGRLDVLPTEDLGLRTAVQKAYGLPHLPKKDDLVDLAGPWRPYCTVATLYLWRGLGTNEQEQARDF